MAKVYLQAKPFFPFGRVERKFVGMEFAEIDKEQWRQIYEDLTVYRMPFGKYKDRLLVSLPDEYLMWFRDKGFPTGRLGELMVFVFEVKMAGAEEVFDPIRRAEHAERLKRKGGK